MKRILNYLCATLLLLSANATLLANDNQLPVDIKANSAEYNNKNGKGVYSGQVEVQQGQTRLQAERASTQNDANNQLIEAIAYGTANNRAFYTAIVDANKPAVEARAHTIKYYPQDQKIVLIGDAEVIQGRDSYRAPHIEYDIENEHVISKASEQGRTVILFYPEDHREENA